MVQHMDGTVSFTGELRGQNRTFYYLPSTTLYIMTNEKSRIHHVHRCDRNVLAYSFWIAKTVKEKPTICKRFSLFSGRPVFHKIIIEYRYISNLNTPIIVLFTRATPVFRYT